VYKSSANAPAARVPYVNLNLMLLTSVQTGFLRVVVLDIVPHSGC